MAVTEEKVTGKKYRVWNGSIWQRLSFWTKASDVECEDGTSVEDKLKNIKSDVDEVEYSEWNTKSDEEKGEYGLVKVLHAPEPATTVAECQEQINELNDSLNNRSVIVEVTSPSTISGTQTYDFPEGFTDTNCYIESAMMYVSDTNVQLQAGEGNNFRVMFSSHKLYISINNNSAFVSKQIKIVLTKF